LFLRSDAGDVDIAFGAHGAEVAVRQPDALDALLAHCVYAHFGLRATAAIPPRLSPGKPSQQQPGVQHGETVLLLRTPSPARRRAVGAAPHDALMPSDVRPLVLGRDTRY
jgi:hypothetical protein